VSRRILFFDVLAVIAACLFVRLGVWQLHRLAERRARNALISSRLQAAPADATSLGGDTAAVHYRRVVVRGAPDYDHEMLLIERTRGGAPGVDLITPVHVPGHDSAVLVLRGWVYSPDGTTIAEQNYRESDSTFTGYLEELVGGATGGALPENPRFLRQMQQVAIAKVVSYPVFPSCRATRRSPPREPRWSVSIRRPSTRVHI